MRGALDRRGDAYPEYLPGDARGQAATGHARSATALEEAHFPTSFERPRRRPRPAGLRRAAGAPDRHGRAAPGAGPGDRQPDRRSTTPTDRRLRAAIIDGIAEKLGRDVAFTADQDRAIADVRADLDAPTPMLRLLQGDVGSGKTAVAA